MMAIKLGDLVPTKLQKLSVQTFLKASPCFQFGRIHSLNRPCIYEYFSAPKATFSNGFTAFWKKIHPCLIALLETVEAL